MCRRPDFPGVLILDENNDEVTQEDFNVDDQIFMSCEPGKQLVGSDDAICDEDGEFKYEDQPQCVGGLKLLFVMFLVLLCSFG